MRIWDRVDIRNAGIVVPVGIPVGDIFVDRFSGEYNLRVDRLVENWPVYWVRITEDEALWMIQEHALDNEFLKSSYGLKEDVL